LKNQRDTPNVDLGVSEPPPKEDKKKRTTQTEERGKKERKTCLTRANITLVGRGGVMEAKGRRQPQLWVGRGETSRSGYDTDGPRAGRQVPITGKGVVKRTSNVA